MLGYDHGTGSRGFESLPHSKLYIDTIGLLSLYMCGWMTNAADGKELGGVWEITGLWHRGETPWGKYWEVGTVRGPSTPNLPTIPTAMPAPKYVPPHRRHPLTLPPLS